jgi:hypothetical protein
VTSAIETTESTSSASSFTPYERDRLEQLQRALVPVVDPDIAPRAARVKYVAGEHRQDWADCETAVGMNVPSTHHLPLTEERLAAETSTATLQRLRELDRFAIRRHPQCIWCADGTEVFRGELGYPAQVHLGVTEQEDRLEVSEAGGKAEIGVAPGTTGGGIACDRERVGPRSRWTLPSMSKSEVHQTKHRPGDVDGRW